MTCQELRDYFCRDVGVDTDVVLGSVDLVEHVAHCPGCNRVVEAQKRLQTNLHLVRDSAPPVPASLDAAVVASYRRYLSDRLSVTRSVPLAKRTPLGVLGWTTALAFALVVAYAGMVLFSPRTGPMPMATNRQRTEQLPKLPRPGMRGNGMTALAEKPAPRTRRLFRRFVRRTGNSVSFTEHYPPPTGFRSLMYCDELSCAGAMGVIRVELPAQLLGSPPASGRANDLVPADVLVGPDGIARGIRVVE